MQSRAFKCFLVTSAATMLALPAWAQTTTSQASDPTATLAEVIVTAQRREESLQRSAAAINVLGAEALERNSVSRAADLNYVSPSVHIVDTGTQNQVRIRGIGTSIISALQNSQIAFSTDGVFNAANTGADNGFYDLQRVEIVKGPQGTLYGKNATGGAINLITNRPTHDFGGSVTVETGNYDALKVGAVLNVPLGETAAARFSFQRAKHDGYLTSGYNDLNDTAGRAQLLLEPTDRLTVLLRGSYSHKGGKGTNFVPLNPTTNDFMNPSNPWQDAPSGDLLAAAGSADQVRCYGPAGNTTAGNAFPYCSDPSGYQDNTTWAVNAQIDYRFDTATLTIIPAYISSKADSRIFGRGLPFMIDSEQPQTSLETRLASSGDTRLDWLVGAYYSHYSNDIVQTSYQPLKRPTFTPFTLYPFVDTITLEDTSYAVFTQEQFALTDTLRLTAGVRYTEEKQSKRGAYAVILGAATAAQPAATATGCAAYAASGATFNGTACLIPEIGDLKEHSFNYKAGVEFDPRPGSLLYANVSTGFHAGGFYQLLPPNTYKPEKLTAYAIGSKNRFFDNRVQLNLETYYWDYTDLQYSQTATLNPAITGVVTVNAGKATVYGLDVDAEVQITRNDRLGVAVDFARGKNDDFKFYAARSPPAGSVCKYTAATLVEDCSGTDLISLPRVSGNASYQHTFRLRGDATIDANVETHFEGASWLFYDQLPAQHQDAYALVNLSLSYDSGRHFGLDVFVNNAANKVIKTFAQTGSFNANSTPYVSLGAPRTYGARIKFTF